MRLFIHIKPNSSAAGIISEELLPGEKFGLFSNNEKQISALKVTVSSAPIDGKANEELIKVVAQYLKISKSKITIVKGLKSRFKILQVSK